MKILKVEFKRQTERNIICDVTIEKSKGFFRKKQVYTERFFLACTSMVNGIYAYGYIPISIETGEDAGIDIYEAMQVQMVRAHQEHIKKN